MAMTRMSAHRHRDAALLFALSSMPALGWLLAELIRGKAAGHIFSESGSIERLSALYLILAALALAGDMTVRGTWRHWHLALLVLAGGLRELDWDKAFTESGVLSLRLYSGTAPWGQKVVGAVVLALLVWAGLRLLRRNMGPWRQGLRNRQAWAWLMALALALYTVAKSLDGLGRKLAPFGIDLAGGANTAASRGEEVLELFGAILILEVAGLRLLRRHPPR